MTTSVQTILGFDYGRRRIGVAIGQTLTRTAAPLATVGTVHDEPDWTAIGALIEQWQPAALVVGLPLHMDDSPHALTDAARGFAAGLEQRYRLPVHLVDERLSSVEAEQQLVAAGRGGKRHTRAGKGVVDREAAQVILQSWLHQHTRPQS